MAKKNGKKALKIVAAVLGALLALYCAYYLTAALVFGDSMPMPFGFGVAVVLTGSMEPSLSANDLIFVAKSSGYQTGDVVVYSTQGTPVVHRIIGIDEEVGAVTTQGDANNTADAPISISKIKGKVVFSIPAVGVIPRFVRTVPGMIMTLVVLFVLLFLSTQSKKKTAEEAESEDKISALLEEVKRLREQAEGSNAGQNENASSDEKSEETE